MLTDLVSPAAQILSSFMYYYFRMPHFFAADLLGVFTALVLGIPVIVLPGFGVGWMLNLLGMRSASNNNKWLLGLVFGISFVPLLAYLSFRLVSASGAIVFLFALALLGSVIAFRERALPELRNVSRNALVAAACWIALALVLSLDVAVGDRLYPSSAVIDTSVRARVISAINHATQLPPPNPFYFDPAHESTLHYHYFLFVVAALIEKLGGGIVTATTSLVAITIWVGLAFLGVFSLVVHRWTSIGHKRIGGLVWLLPLIGGMDVLPVGVEIARRIRLGISPFPIPDIEWWNGQGQVFAWLDTAVWHPHHLASLCAAVVGCLILWESREEGTARRIASCLGAAMCFAASAGLSALVAIVFILYLGLVTVELVLNSPKHAMFVALSGIMSLALVWPFLHEVHGPSGGGGGASFQFVVRAFDPADSVLTNAGVKSAVAWNVVRMLSLPLNYLLELGFFFVVGIWWLYEYKVANREKDFKAHFQISLLAFSIVLVSFISYGTIAANDFGYRGILPAQFVLLMWAADLVQRYAGGEGAGSRVRERAIMAARVTAVIGLCSLVLGCVMMRGSIGITEAGLDVYYSPLRGQHPAERLYDLRESYSWIRKNTSRNVVVQESPLTFESISAQFGERRTARDSWFDGDAFVRNDGKSSPVFDNALKLFSPGLTEAEKIDACRVGGINYVIVKDNDAIWFDRSSYVWTEPVVYARNRVRVFECSGATKK